MFLFAKYDNTIVGRHQPQYCLESAKTYTYDLIFGLSWDPVGVLEVGELKVRDVQRECALVLRTSVSQS